MIDSELRAMAAEDLPAVLQIIGAHSTDDGRLSEAYFRRYFADAARLASPREQSLVAQGGCGLVGVASFGPDKYDWPDVLWINWFYVRAEARGQGLGSRLLQEVVARARALQIRKLYLNTDSPPSYAAARRLYSGFGFQEEGRLLDYYRPDDHYIIMGLTL